MNDHFPRIITLLRKERKLSQKKAAEALGVSQALLSHYEKGIRECGLDFVTRAADFYDVSCDYLLGRSPNRNGAILSVEDIPEPDAAGKENVFRGSLLPTLNKKLLANSLNIIYDLLQKSNNKALTGEISAGLNAAVYRSFRILYSANEKNPQGLFSIPEPLSDSRSGYCRGQRRLPGGRHGCGGAGGAEKGRRSSAFSRAALNRLPAVCGLAF